MYLKNLLNSKKFKIFVLIFSLCITFYVLFHLFHASNIIFTSTDISVNKNPVAIVEPFEITATIGAASSESPEVTYFTIFVDKPNIVFPSFNNNFY